MQLDPSQFQAFLSYGLAAAAGIATYVNLKLKSDVQTLKTDVEKANSALESRITDKLDRFRQEFASSFVPERLASEQRSSLVERLKRMDEEIAGNRTRTHELANDILKNIVPEIFKINNQLTDKARRMATYDERFLAFDRLENEHNDRIRDLEERLRSLETRS
jgi:chromosome segregation ATPase